MAKLLDSILDILPKINEFHTLPASVSNRHIHLTRETLDILFGKGYELTKLKDLSQPGQFAANETVSIIGPKGRIDKVRILGPTRKTDQIEVSISDGYKLGIYDIPILDSGDYEHSIGITVEGPKATLKLEKGLMVAANHLHCSPSEAEKFGFKDKDKIDLLSVKGRRVVVFSNVLVRVNKAYRLDFHIDIDEANAAGIKTGDKVYLLSIKRDIVNTKKVFLTEAKLKEILRVNPNYKLEDNVVLTPAARDYAREKKLILGWKRIK